MRLTAKSKRLIGLAVWGIAATAVAVYINDPMVWAALGIVLLALVIIGAFMGKGKGVLKELDKEILEFADGIDDDSEDEHVYDCDRYRFFGRHVSCYYKYSMDTGTGLFCDCADEDRF